MTCPTLIYLAGECQLFWRVEARDHMFLMSMLSILALAGCSMCFVPTGLVPPKPYGSLWVKDGVTAEQKRQDSWACGALPIPDAENRPAFSDEKIRAEKHPEDRNNTRAYLRLTKAWSECMKAKGYIYRGPSYDLENVYR